VEKGVPEGTEIIYKGRNTVYRMPVNGVTLIIKAFKLPNVINAYIYTTLRKSKAERSYINAKRLQQYGFLTPAVVAYAEVRDGMKLRESYYISEEFKGSEIREWEKLPDSESLLHALAGEMVKMHEAGVWHKDFSPGNVLYSGDKDKGYRFYYVDLNRMQFGVKSKKKLMSMFKSINLNREETLRLAREYAKVSGRPIAEVEAEANMAMDAYHKRRQDKQRLKKLLRRN
jgi:tRNA A-37 threonylcarbamoyl transferase component Bud32